MRPQARPQGEQGAEGPPVIGGLEEADFRGALALLATAAALGLPVPAPAGCTAHAAAIVGTSDGNRIDLGLYATRDDALAAAREWILSELDDLASQGFLPAEISADGEWRTGERDAWLATHTDAQIVEAYMKDVSNDDVRIEEIRILAGPARQ